jgi:signal transduction histidine kinase
LWDYSAVLNQGSIIDEYFRAGETYFLSNSLIDYLTVYDTIKTSDNIYYAALFQPIEKNYKIENEYFAPLSITEQLTNQFNTEFEFNFFREAQPSRDGRKHSFPILNNNNNKIGIVTFLKPLRESALQAISNTFNILQSLLTLFLFMIVGVSVIKYTFQVNYRIVKFLIISSYITGLRFVIHTLGITSLFKNWDIAKSKYFSSLFGFGIASSPLELFLSVLGLIGMLFKYVDDYYKNIKHSQHKSLSVFIISLIFFGFLYLLSLRGLGASIKSIILDSSLRYYRESSLFPSSIETFMLFNVLLIGLTIFVGTLSFLVIVISKVPQKYKRINVFFLLFLIIQFSGLVFDLIQKEPQGTPFFRVLFILASFVALYFIIQKSSGGIRQVFFYSIISSVLVIILLTQYNSLVEKESLRKTAYNLTRQNEDLLKFAVQETLVSAITDRETVQAFYYGNKNASSVAFKLWSNSILQKESLGSSVSLLDSNHYPIGSFDFRFNREFRIDWDKYSDELSDLHEIKVFEEDILFSDNKVIRGIATVENVEGVLGYVTVSVIYDLSSLGILDAPDFIISDAGYINDAIDYTKLKIFDFHQGTLINSISNYNLGENEILSILSAPFDRYGEAWLKLEINNEEHLLFVLRHEQDNISRIIAVALKEKELSWGLFDFFKIFFVHLVIILTVFLIYLAYLLYKTRKLKISFAVKLLLSFILVSLIPLILVSFFFRTVTTEKNESAIEYKLEKRAKNVQEYLSNYIHTSSLNLKGASEKASDDLGINFTLYNNYNYLYSSNEQYYKVGLIPQVLNPVAFEKLMLQGTKEILINEKIENYNFNAFYYKFSILGEYHVIKVSDAFNRILLPLSGQEVDVYIFVSYSVALIIILILGFILTKQISQPIEKLKNATRSVASGDLNVQVKVTSEDEVGELVKGFNYMVKELKRSQAELAEFERETAWKEMAKQVAHEIKNPLTPMKLSMQQLKVAYDDNSPKFKELFEKVSKTIINQIDTLKNIASEFSSFARMPNPKLEIINIKDLINNAVNLFSDEKINFVITGDSYNVEADKEQLSRVFVNLIRNSIQADSTKIKIDFGKEEEFLVVNFKDNGKGINPESVDKIFEINFSTKEQGMGIGLSMAKKTIENIGGEIILKETSNQGTTFQIKLPVI